ncbi:uncharacterized protein LOC132174252 [Corylus avellana]|uniref:uncharacterized protein LOC132174252 n=1 Tax=Corylus avellana TaxID=13451 RepID=UPI00286A37E7|nr:uncharacterized protein LOC132174252 [Corylus avellana]
MMTILKEMFREQSRAAKSDTMRTLLNIKMVEGSPMREHCLVMIAMLNTLELRLNELMDKKEYTFAELMNELIGAKNILKSKVIVNFAHASDKGPKGSKKHLKPVANLLSKSLRNMANGQKARKW